MTHVRIDHAIFKRYDINNIGIAEIERKTYEKGSFINIYWGCMGGVVDGSQLVIYCWCDYVENGFKYLFGNVLSGKVGEV